MILQILLGTLILLVGIYIGIQINKWSLRINEKIKKQKDVERINNIFKIILTNLKENKTKFKTRVNNTIYIGTKIPEIGKVDLVCLIDKKDIAIFQGHKCIITTQDVERQTIDEILDTINMVHNEKINDVVDVLGLIFSREEFEKTFQINVEDIKKKSQEIVKELSDVDNIVSSNRKKFDIDEILDKISRVGINNLTAEEKKFLDNYNK